MAPEGYMAGLASGPTWRRPLLLVLCGALQLRILPVCALENGVRAPPMGWMSWERFGCQRDCATFPDDCINAALYKSMANTVVNQGFREAGYKFINVDDCYLQRTRDSAGNLQADPTRFPGGMEALGQYLHGLGLKFGVYNDIGAKTCMGDPGLDVSPAPDAVKDSQLQRDILQMVTRWQIDMLKVDGCNSNVGAMGTTYPKLGRLLNSTGRQVVYSCSWPYSLSCEGNFNLPQCFPWPQLVNTCNTWRPYQDVMDAFNLPGHGGVKQIVEVWARYNETLAFASRPGAYNDPDMILAGNPGLSLAEATIQFGMWAMWSAPLLLGADLRRIDGATRQLLLNADIIAVDQDPAGVSATGVVLDRPFKPLFGEVSRWWKPLANGDVAVAFLNLGAFDGEHFRASFQAADVGLPAGNAFKVRDLVYRRDLPGVVTTWTGIVPATSLTMLRVTPVGGPRVPFVRKLRS